MTELKERMTAGEYAVYADVMRVKTESPEPHHQARKKQIEEANAGQEGRH